MRPFNQFITEDIVSECRKRLLVLRQDLMNRSRAAAVEFSKLNKNIGDEIDQTNAQLEEHSFLVNQDRIRAQLLEINFALAKIESGTFGICEETEEPIEIERLLAIPWTRVSIEGAEIREALGRKYAGF